MGRSRRRTRRLITCSIAASESRKAFSPLIRPDQSGFCGFAKGRIHTEPMLLTPLHMGSLQILLLGLKVRRKKLGATVSVVFRSSASGATHKRDSKGSYLSSTEEQEKNTSVSPLRRAFRRNKREDYICKQNAPGGTQLVLSPSIPAKPKLTVSFERGYKAQRGPSLPVFWFGAESTEHTSRHPRLTQPHLQAANRRKKTQNTYHNTDLIS